VTVSRTRLQSPACRRRSHRSSADAPDVLRPVRLHVQHDEAVDRDAASLVEALALLAHHEQAVRASTACTARSGVAYAASTTCRTAPACTVMARTRRAELSFSTMRSAVASSTRQMRASTCSSTRFDAPSTLNTRAHDRTVRQLVHRLHACGGRRCTHALAPTRPPRPPRCERRLLRGAGVGALAREAAARDVRRRARALTREAAARRPRATRARAARPSQAKAPT
jgi:hypothetical protein